ncbi:hypothetical protein C8F04DRAFT_1081707 [Mycena alexandri]|uniref:Uncharacterized protein n=1 Tax=Mycena alexandri TaxID=1745969 RepID=A0AAD6T907_9AGAR|nr:hypothetical protein C8F04DRAFT_1081707 [Mycena alexandri]
MAAACPQRISNPRRRRIWPRHVGRQSLGFTVCIIHHHSINAVAQDRSSVPMLVIELPLAVTSIPHGLPPPQVIPRYVMYLTQRSYTHPQKINPLILYSLRCAYRGDYSDVTVANWKPDDTLSAELPTCLGYFLDSAFTYRHLPEQTLVIIPPLASAQMAATTSSMAQDKTVFQPCMSPL